MNQIETGSDRPEALPSTQITLCLDSGTLAKLAQGELPEPVLSLALIHVEYCASCQKKLDASIRETSRGLNADLEADQPDEIPEFLFQLPEREHRPDDSAERPFADGKQFGRFKLIRLVKDGVTCAVYEAWDPKLNRRVALKALKPSVMELSSALGKQFLEEARIVAQIQNPHVVPIFDVDVVENTPFIVMPFLQGETLEDRLAKGSIEPGQALAMTLNLVDGLEASHQAGIIHRDIKPGNLWVAPQAHDADELMILDFGIAHLNQNLKEERSGSPSYMSPEQALGQPTDYRSDYFSVGCVLFEMLAGKAAWPSNAQEEFRNPLLDRDLPTPTLPILKQLLAFKPEARFQDHASLRASIQKVLVHYHKKKIGLNIAIASASFLFGVMALLVFVRSGEKINNAENAKSSGPSIARSQTKRLKANVLHRFRASSDGPLSSSKNGSLLVRLSSNAPLNVIPPNLNEAEAITLPDSEGVRQACLSSDTSMVAGYALNPEGNAVLRCWRLVGDGTKRVASKVVDYDLLRADLVDISWAESDGSLNLVTVFESLTFLTFEYLASFNEMVIVDSTSIEEFSPGRWYSNPAGSQHVIAMKPGGLVIYNQQKHKIDFAFRDFFKGPVLVSWTPDGKQFAAASPLGEVNLYDRSKYVNRRPASENALIPQSAWDIKMGIQDLMFIDNNRLLIAVDFADHRFILLDKNSDRITHQFIVSHNKMIKWARLPAMKIAILDSQGEVQVFELNY